MSEAERARHPTQKSLAANDPFTIGRFALGLALLLFVAFPDVLLGWRSFFTRDFSSFGYPLACHVQQSFRGGEIPLWNPYNFGGLPFLAQWNTLAVYPLSLIYILLPLPWSLNLFNILHVYLGGLGMFCLARGWLKDGRAASVAGVGYAFGGVLVSALMWPNNIAALGWLPAVLLAGERAAFEGGKYCIHSAILLGLQSLAGAPEITALTWAGLALLGHEAASVPIARRFLRLAIVMAVAVGLAALQLLPFFELLRQSQRGAGYSTGDWTLSWSGLGNFLVPLFRTFPDRDGVFFQQSQQWVTSYYAGLTLLVPAIAALTAGRNRRVALLAGVATVSLLLALGSNGLVYEWLRKLLPPLGVMRYPIKFIVPVAVVLPLLAAYGMHAWLEGRIQARTMARLAIALAVLTLGLIALSQTRPAPRELPKETLQSGVVALLCSLVLWLLLVGVRRSASASSRWLLPLAMVLAIYADLLLANKRVNPTVPSGLMTGKAADIIPWPTLGSSRVMVNPAAHAKLDATIFTRPEAAVQIPRSALVLNHNLIERVPKLDGFFSLYLPGPAAITWRLAKETGPAANGLRDFLGVSHVSDSQKPWQWNARSNWLPWMSIAPRAVFADSTNVVRELLSERFNPREVVFLPPEGLATRTAGSGRGTIVEPRFASQSVNATIVADAPLLLTLAQANHSSWRASVDGLPAPIFTANGAFQALEVPGGRHEVKVVFRSAYFEAGTIISVLSLLACVFYRFVLRKSIRRGGAISASNRRQVRVESVRQGKGVN